mmetsp:Transcript_20888/g.30064  ORF Transcript_20888/g.30064 Transcript_20888/m.30064 type:complete len:194 (-) Transcript_20888:190-771(-)
MATCKDCDCDNYREELLAASDKLITPAGNCANCNHPLNRHPRTPVAGLPTASAPVECNPSMEKEGGQPKIVMASAINISTPSEQPGYTENMPVYDSSRGGYVTGTGRVMGNTTEGDYNDYGRRGVGVNSTVESQGDMAYGGALGAPYGDPYSVRRTHAGNVTTSSTGSTSATSISITDINASYGDPYSVKRMT